MINMVKLPTNKSNLFLRVAKGHFATSHSHINYYIDVTTQKSRLSEAKAVAKELVAAYQLWNAPFYSVLGVLLATRYALQSLGQKVLPLFSSVIELVGKVVFVLFFIPKFAYNAVILCEPIIWCFMAAYLVLVYLHDPFVFPKKAE